MKDFSHYKKHVEIDMKSYSGNFHFNEQLKQEGTDININEQSTQKIDGVNTTIRAIVRNTGVENKEATEERSIMIGKEYAYKCGDYVEYLYDTYLTIACVDKDNPFFNTSKIKRTNYTLKWMIEGVPYNIPCVISNQTKYTLGISSQVAGITEGSSRYQVLMSYNSFSKTIDEGQRFIFNGNAWKTTQVDFVSEVGLMSLLLGQDSINYEIDDVLGEIADKWLNSYAITLNSTSESIQVDGNYQITPIVTNNGDTVNNPTITYISSNEDIATVNNGLVTAISIGNATITCSIGSVLVDFNLIVTADTETPVISYGYAFSQGTTIRQYVTSTLNCTKTIDTVSSPLNISCSWDTLGQSLISSGKITVTTKSSSSIAIKNVGVVSNTVIHLTVTDSDTGTIIAENVAITLTGM